MKQPIKVEYSYNLFFKEYPDVLTTKDLQSILGISSKTVFRLLHSGQIKALKLEETSVYLRSIYSNIWVWSRMKSHDTSPQNGHSM